MTAMKDFFARDGDIRVASRWKQSAREILILAGLCSGRAYYCPVLLSQLCELFRNPDWNSSGNMCCKICEGIEGDMCVLFLQFAELLQSFFYALNK
jgi:hypothetical protein